MSDYKREAFAKQVLAFLALSDWVEGDKEAMDNLDLIGSEGNVDRGVDHLGALLDAI